MQGCFITQLPFGPIRHLLMVEDQFGNIVQMEPFCVIFVAELSFVLVNVDECEIGDAEGPFYGIPFGGSECL